MKAYILPRYVMRFAFVSMLGAVVGLWLLQMIFAYLSELENLNDTYTFKEAWWFILYRSPYFLVQFLPTGILLGAVVGLGMLANHSELVVMRASGVSIYRIIGYAMIPALLFVFVSLGVNQFVLPITNQKASAITSQTTKSNVIAVRGYWTLNQKENGSQEIVYISYADNQGKLGDVKRYTLDNNANLIHALSAKDGIYQHQKDKQYLWRLSDTNHVDISVQGVTQKHIENQLLALPIAPTDVHLLTTDADDLSVSDLYAHKRLMTHQGARSLRHELAFWQKLLSPFSVLSLVLLASSFVFGSLRSQGLGLRIVMALLTGLLFSYLTDLVGFVSLATGFSPFIMALLPIVISAGVGVWLLNKRQ
ncbi:LPS export ABC transporter permease LptG [Moraxella oblonga]|uniref:LPS export ABC transporter permease LptG n=1 Tax=Moraxella oblonga TaxID=200413 RepID=UPI00082BCF9D|nr:LPS export ABC transporter permease LptG [Moraxella oblonga]